MQFPPAFLDSLTGIQGFDREAFEKVHAGAGQVTSVRLNPLKLSHTVPHFPIPHFKIPWTDFGYYLNERPSFTFDPLFHAGCYYVQEASSMFLEQALKQTVDLSKPIKVLDLCAAPGGKSTHIQSLISGESLLVSNEVIKSRVNVLKDNMIKWGAENAVVTQNDPKDFAGLENYFDVMVVDAPCSGSGLFRKDPEAMKEWSLNNVQLCSHRQQRILADVMPALKKNGMLIYSTCSYSAEEDEEIAAWLQKEYNLLPVAWQLDPQWGIVQTENGYRFWPDKVKGEGFFMACFRKKDGEDFFEGKTKNKLQQLSKSEVSLMESWVQNDRFELIKKDKTVYAILQPHVQDIALLSGQLRVLYEGVETGEIMHDKLIPAHALALSAGRKENIPVVELNYEQAIEYLKKKELKTEIKTKGWQVVKYEGHALGWINVLHNRINNYYPKEMRIWKDR